MQLVLYSNKSIHSPKREFTPTPAHIITDHHLCDLFAHSPNKTWICEKLTSLRKPGVLRTCLCCLVKLSSVSHVAYRDDFYTGCLTLKNFVRLLFLILCLKSRTAGQVWLLNICQV